MSNRISKFIEDESQQQRLSATEMARVIGCSRSTYYRKVETGDFTERELSLLAEKIGYVLSLMPESVLPLKAL